MGVLETVVARNAYDKKTMVASISKWADACCVADSVKAESGRGLYSSFAWYCKMNAGALCTEAQFYGLLGKRHFGLKPVVREKTRRWLGLSVKESCRPPASFCVPYSKSKQKLIGPVLPKSAPDLLEPGAKPTHHATEIRSPSLDFRRSEPVYQVDVPMAGDDDDRL